MYFEGLAVEIYATKAGWEPMKPPRIRGTSGVEHRFSFLARYEDRSFAFELFPEVGELEVLKAYAKQLDTGVKMYVVCLKGKATHAGAELAKEYGMQILGPGDIAPFFDNREWLGTLPMTLAESKVLA